MNDTNLESLVLRRLLKYDQQALFLSKIIDIKRLNIKKIKINANAEAEKIAVIKEDLTILCHFSQLPALVKERYVYIYSRK
mgnify:FL=1